MNTKDRITLQARTLGVLLAIISPWIFCVGQSFALTISYQATYLYDDTISNAGVEHPIEYWNVVYEITDPNHARVIEDPTHPGFGTLVLSDFFHAGDVIYLVLGSTYLDGTPSWLLSPPEPQLISTSSDWGIGPISANQFTQLVALVDNASLSPFSATFAINNFAPDPNSTPWATWNPEMETLFYLDDYSSHGWTVPASSVPEPSTMLLLGSGLLGLVGLNRRRKA